MFTHGFDLMRYHEAKYQQLLQEAQQYRLVQEALRARPSKARSLSNLLAFLGSLLVDLGADLQKRYGTSPQAVVQQKQRSNPECC